jgi:IS30 family transposase
MVNISERPPEVEDRAVPGHWEGDLICGTANRSAIGTLVERSSRFVMLLHLPNGHGADAVQEAMLAKIASLPDALRRSLTWDQGAEMANHLQITEATGMDIYFCDPASPWQRGSNENTNGLLRQYFPKGTDLSGYPADYLDYIADKLNRRIRETLGWLTPAQRLDQLLSQPPNTGVAPLA